MLDMMMTQEFEAAGWVWVDVQGPEQLDRNKEYRIEVGRELWPLRYGGLHEWVACRRSGEPEVVANELIRAGCAVYARREPVRFEAAARLVVENGKLVIDGLAPSVVPKELLEGVVNVCFVEGDFEPDPEVPDVSPEQAFWFRG